MNNKENTNQVKADLAKLEIGMFGMSEAEMWAGISEEVKSGKTGLLGLAMSWISDAQEQFDLGLDQQANQTLNRAKALIVTVNSDLATGR